MIAHGMLLDGQSSHAKIDRRSTRSVNSELRGESMFKKSNPARDNNDHHKQRAVLYTSRQGANAF